MATMPIHLQPPPDTACGSQNRNGLRVPFGLRDGRVWAPREVEPGLACRCVCPACQQPLVAKVDRPAFRRHPQAIIPGYSRGVHEQQAVHG